MLCFLFNPFNANPSLTAELWEWTGLTKHLTKRMAAGFLPDHIPPHTDAFHASYLLGPQVPLHHRAGPQSLHRHCGKTSANVLFLHFFHVDSFIFKTCLTPHWWPSQVYSVLTGNATLTSNLQLLSVMSVDWICQSIVYQSNIMQNLFNECFITIVYP